MKKLLLFGLLLIPVIAFTGCSMTSSLSDAQHLNSQEITYYEFHIKEAKKEYELCGANQAYRNKHQDRCSASRLALKDTGNTKQISKMR